MLIQKRPEETSPREFQMGQILHSSGSSKPYESRTTTTTSIRRFATCPLLFLLFLSSGIYLELVGAISFAEPPLNLNADANGRPGPSSTATGRGDELGASETDVFHSFRVMDYSASPASKFASNGQFMGSTLTEGKTSSSIFPKVSLHQYEAESLSTTNSPLRPIRQEQPSRKPTLVPGEIRLQSDSPLSPIVTQELDNNAELKSNLGTLHHSGKEVDQDAFDNLPFTPTITTTNTQDMMLPKSISTTSSEETREKPTNINLLRKLWSSTRSSKLNLTHEHQSLLRIESEKSNRSNINRGGGGGGTDDKEPTNSNGSRSIADLSGTPWTTESHPTPGFISSILHPVELTSLRPTPLKLGEKDKEAPFQRKQTPAVISNTPPETTITSGLPQHSIKLAFNDGTELSTSTPPNISGGPRDNKFPKPGGRRAPMLYPEWLSSGGGVYPDDSTNGTGEYYGESEYENLISNNENKGDGGGGNPGEREEEAPGRRRILHTDFLERFANLSSWQNRLKLREQQVLDDKENRIAASLSAASASADTNTLTEAPEAIIAQTGLADVISRGRIDSVRMYVYFGDRYNNDYHKEEVAGRVIQAVGGVIAAIAQVLTVLGAAKCVRKSTQSNQLPIHLHIGFALLISNLLLLLAVHATEPADVCATVAMILHYLHLVIGCWLFAHTIRTYLKVARHAETPNLISSDSNERPREIKLWSNSLCYCFASWTAPLPFIFMSYFANPDGYETRHFCWMSIEKGMVISFIVPVFILIGVNTVLVVLSLRHLLAQRKLWADSTSAEMDEDTLDERKISSGIRASAMLLPLLSLMWFLGVVALENASSIFFQIASASASIALSWLVLYFLGDEMWPGLWCWCARRDQSASSSSSLFSTDDGECHSVQPGAHLSFDNEPLLAASSTSSLQVPSTSSAYGVDVGHSVCKPVSSSSSKTVGASQGMYAPILPGPSNRGGKRQHKSSKRPNWSTPGGNEIYELKMDSISTICT